MLNVLKEGIRKVLSWYRIPTVKSCIILSVSTMVVLFVSATMHCGISYTSDQLSYTVTGGKVGYIDNGSPDIFSYGPYSNLKKGIYRITFDYETDTETTYDICFRDETEILKILKNGMLECGSNHKSVIIINKEEIGNQSFEVRTWYSGVGYLQINGISVTPVFQFDRYVFVTLITMIISLMFLCGKRLSGLLHRPREVLGFACFYMAVLCLCLYAMAYLTDKDRMWLHGILNFLVVIHSYECRKGIYDNDIVVAKIRSLLCYVFQFYSLFRLDRVMRGIVSQTPKKVYANDTPFLFTISIVVCIVLIAALIRRLWVKRVFYGVVYYAFVLLLVVQSLYYQVFGRLFSFKDIQLAGEGMEYAGYILDLMDAELFTTLILLIVIGMAGIYLLRYTQEISREWKVAIGSVAVTVLLYTNTIYIKDDGDNLYYVSDSFIYNTMNDRGRAFKLCGFYQYELKDLKKAVFKEQEGYKEQITKAETFFECRAGEIALDTNAMTGILKGKNVIFVLMESIDDIACNEDVMPTLYRMSKEGIHFSNTYASIYGAAATLNSEMVTNIGCYAPQDGSMINTYADNCFPYSLAARFTDAGYAARQYHYNDPKFYNRELLNKTFGYGEYVWYENYREAEEDSRMDTVLAENDELYQTLIQDEKFFDYIISYTAHVSYEKTDKNVQMALELHPEYEEMTNSEEVNNYFAKARITDDMLGGLVQRLETDNLLENTVIVAIGDHYPYGITDKDLLYDLSGVEQYEQLLYKVPFVIWTPGMEAMEVDKIASSIDVVPTIVNLMGLGDCSMYVGNDIFNEKYEGYAYFSDGSWLCGDSYYYQGQLVYGTMDETGIDDMNSKVMEAITVNDCILHTDYWRNHK